MPAWVAPEQFLKSALFAHCLCSGCACRLMKGWDKRASSHHGAWRQEPWNGMPWKASQHWCSPLALAFTGKISMSISPTCVDTGCGCFKKAHQRWRYAGIDDCCQTNSNAAPTLFFAEPWQARRSPYNSTGCTAQSQRISRVCCWLVERLSPNCLISFMIKSISAGLMWVT